MNADVIIGEESAYMSEAVWHDNVLPLFAIARSALIMISTPGTENNFYNRLLDMKLPDGTNFAHVVKVELSCRRCKELGATEFCRHMMHLVPKWKKDGGDKLSIIRQARFSLSLSLSLFLLPFLFFLFFFFFFFFFYR
jgi:hypothetical protein